MTLTPKHLVLAAALLTLTAALAQVLPTAATPAPLGIAAGCPASGTYLLGTVGGVLTCIPPPAPPVDDFLEISNAGTNLVMLSHVPADPARIAVHRNGLLEHVGVDFTVASTPGSTALTFAQPFNAGDTIEAQYASQ